MPHYERKELRESVRVFAATHLTKEVLRQIDEQDEIPEDLLREIAERGYLGIGLPAEYGGGDLDMPDFLVFSEELSRASMVIFASVVSPAMFSAWRIIDEGTEAQRTSLVPAIISGAIRMSGTALTEPNAGSDLSALSTRATRTSTGWRLNGTKMLIGGAIESNLILVLARVEGRAPKDDLNFFLVPNPTDGVTIRRLPALGSHGVSTCAIDLVDADLEESALLGGEAALGKGWEQLMRDFGTARLTTAAICLGVAQRGLDLAVAFASERQQFGQPIGNFQSIAHLLADRATDIAAARALLYEVADDYRSGVVDPGRISMTKLLTAEVAKRTAIDGMQVFGGRGYLKEYEMERVLRDSFLYAVGGGTPQIHRTTIAKSLGLRP
jgi:alkylation response protein AidB-like acyl-CoA dehydrogenase